MDANGNRVGELRYTPYGVTRYEWGILPTDRLYTGQRWDSALGLYDYRARYYHPALGRFVQPDPLVPEPGNPQDLNRYSYVRNSPVLYRDPSGRAVCVDAECAWIVHPVTGEIRQRAPTNSPPESPQAYSPTESYQEAVGLVNEFRSNMGPFERDFGPTHSLTQDIMYSSGIKEFHRVWAEAGYPVPFEWEHHLDVRDPREGPYPVRFIKSLPVYIGAQVKLGRAGMGLGSKIPEGPIDAVDGTIGSLDVIRVERVGPDWVKIEVENRMNWYSGLRVPGGNFSLWVIPVEVAPNTYVPFGIVWAGIVGGSHETKQTFYWWEPMPNSR
ncbi:MAG: RHS repeat-associated core domain-containing protein [Thermoflexales bacterium]|nr:RHS repeat-associated core domain-containing protein [Thermoflexales bacterium]